MIGSAEVQRPSIRKNEAVRAAPSIVTRTRENAAPRVSGWRMRPLRTTDFVVAVTLFVGAIAVRWPLISRGETLLHSDEAVVGLMAQDIAAGRHYPIYFYGQRYMGALEAYVIAAISPLIHDPIIALRMGPALFFAALVAVQFLMLTRWFGRRGGLVGAATLLAGSPMFAQWSISARGGYIEILLWGSLLLWTYSEWFAGDASPPSIRQRLVFGFLIGSGFWLNPSIVLFAAPIALHYGLNKWNLYRREEWRGPARRLADRVGLAALPTLALAAILLVNSLYAVWVENGRVHQMVLFNIFPKPAAIGVIVLVIGTFCYYLRRAYQSLGCKGAPREGFDAAQRSFTVAALIGPVILGALLGAVPAALYVVRTTLGVQPLEPSLPLGLRPIWETASTFSFLWHGLPLLFGADARPFLELVTIGRPSPLTNLGLVESAVVTAANWVVLGGALSCAIVFVLAYRRPIASLLRMKLTIDGPVVLLTLCAVVTLALFLLGGCTHDFNTIRYLIPLWAILPGLLAATFICRRRFAARLAPICLLVAWFVGQVAMADQLGRPHPLRPLAHQLVAKKIDPAVADIFDAHLLSYLTGQRCHIAEFDPFWSRLAHYDPLFSKHGPVDYIVRTTSTPEDLIPWRYPGPPPPETVHPLWQYLHDAIAKDPSRCLDRETLVGGYERIRLAR